MNELIIELADQAVEEVSAGPWNISDEFCIKFAHLIIRECAAAVAKANNPLGRNIDKVFEMHFRVKP